MPKSRWRRAARQPAGRLRVNAASPFMLHAIVPLVPEFRKLYPQISLELDTDDLPIDLLERRTDIAIRIGPLRDSTLHARPLGTHRLRVLASPAYLEAHGKPRTTAELADHALLGFTQPESLNRWPLRGAHGDEWPIAPTLAASSGETLRQLALAGAGIVCLADFMTGADRASGALVQVLAKETVDVRQPVNAVYYRNTQLSARITSFLDFLSQRMT
jgi:DNA-binding transcriptional LysR family regulator